MYKFIILALFLLPAVTTAQSFTITSDPNLTNTAKQFSTGVECGNGVCVNLRQDCQVSTIFTRQIVNGVTGLDVVSLQDFLVKQGFLVIPKGAQYGTFGPLTSSALARYQRVSKLLQTGVVDEATRSNLNNLVFTGRACHSYYRPDQLDVSFAKTYATKTIAQDLNSNGYTSAFGQLFCTISTKGGCLNVLKTKSFTLSVPSRMGIVRSATYLKSDTLNFNMVSYVRAQKSDIRFKAPQYAVTYVDVVSTSTASTSTTPTFDYTFTVPGRIGTATEAQEIEALLSIDIVSLDSRIYGSWALRSVNGIPYSNDSEEQIVLKLQESPRTIEISGCGKVTGTMHGTVGVMKIEQVQTDLRQCVSQNKIFKQGELYQALSGGVRFTVTDTKLILTSGTGATLEFSRI